VAWFSKPGEGERHRSTPRIEARNAHWPPDHDACIAPSATRTHLTVGLKAQDKSAQGNALVNAATREPSG